MSTKVLPGALSSGEIFNDRYEIVRLVGKGGMASVYEVKDLKLAGERFALKLFSSMDDDPTMVDRFRNEARLTRKLLHPSIVRTFEFDQTEDGRPFMILEFVEGMTLREYSRRQKLTIRECVEILRQIAEAVHYSHEQGILHRDLKSENILMTKEGKVKVNDFGLARTLHGDVRLTQKNEAVGTPLYMPPELIQGKDTDGRADIYAIGIIGFEIATQSFPHYSENWFELANKVVREEIPHFAEQQNFPSWYETFVHTAAAKQREQRFTSGRQIIEFLDSQGGYDVAASLESLSIKPVFPTKPSWIPAAIGFGSVFLVLLPIGYVSFSASAARKPVTQPVALSEQALRAEPVRPTPSFQEKPQPEPPTGIFPYLPDRALIDAAEGNAYRKPLRAPNARFESMPSWKLEEELRARKRRESELNGQLQKHPRPPFKR